MSWLLEHLVSGALVVLAVAVLVRLARPRPAVAHVLWVLALVKLLVPAVVPLRVLPSPWSSPEAAVAAGGPGATSSRFNLPASQRLLPKPNLRVAVPLVAPVGGNAGADDRMHAPIAGATGEATPSPALELAGTVTPAAANPAIPWPALLLLVWAAGAVRVGLGVWRSVRSVRRQMAQASDPTPAQQRALDELAAALEVVAPRMRVVPGRGSPFIWAWGRAVLVWPSQWSACDSASRAILAHELAHLRRRDHWIARFEVIASALLWWHPLFWWTRSRLRQEAELACDAWALWAVPRARRAYASALIDTLEQEVQAMPVATALGARSPTRRAFERRLTMILNHRVPRHFASWAALPVLGLSMAFVAGPAFAQDPEERGKSRSLERRVERAVRAALEQEEARGGLPSGLSVRVEIESEDEADAKHSDDAEGAADAMRAALREARREIRSDPDLRELGIAGDVEGLVGSLLDGDGDFGGALESLIGKAMSQGLAEARMEIRSDPDLRELGLTGDVEELVGSLLGDGDGDFGGALESLVGKAMSQGLAEAKMEIRNDPELRELGIAGDVEGLVGSLLGDGDGDFGGALESLIGKAMSQGLAEAKLEIRNDPELRELGIAGDVEGLVGSLMGDGDDDFGGALESLIGKAMSQGLAEAKMEIRNDPELRALGITGDVEGLVGSLLDGDADEFGDALGSVIEGAMKAAQEGRAGGRDLDDEGEEMGFDIEIDVDGDLDQLIEEITAEIREAEGVERSVRKQLEKALRQVKRSQGKAPRRGKVW